MYVYVCAFMYTNLEICENRIFILQRVEKQNIHFETYIPSIYIRKTKYYILLNYYFITTYFLYVFYFYALPHFILSHHEFD